MLRKKISLIGAGQIGGTMALLLAQEQFGDVVLFDVVEGLPQGKALDILTGRSMMPSATTVIGTNDYEDINDSDIVVVTAGLPRRIGMSREDLLEQNFQIIKKIGIEIRNRAPNAMVIVVTNPVDPLVYAMQKITGFSPNKVVGQAGVLDSSRLACFIAEELQVSAEDVHAMVMGGHGNEMVGIYSACSVQGIGLWDFITKETFDKLAKRAAMAGSEVISLLKTGSAFYSTALAAIKMVDAYLLDKRSVFTAVVKLEGEYGVNGVYCGAPIVMGGNGVERILKVSLSEEEKEQFERSLTRVIEMENWIDKQIDG
ncbi:MAG: malate dehydrogenase [Fibrobacterales bacterium]